MADDAVEKPGGLTMPMPNFLIIGAKKAGTTSVFRYLGQHKDVCISAIKEPAFFSRGSAVLPMILKPIPVVEDPIAYRALFNGAEGAKASGEASPIYLADPGAAARIRRHSPDTKLIVLLRDPVDRFYSEYWMCVRDNVERRSVKAVIDDELERTPLNPVGYLGRGLYASQLRRYFDQFDRSQIAIGLFDDLCGDPAQLVRDLLRFLGVTADVFTPDVSVHYNASGQPRVGALKPLLGKSKITKAIRLALPSFLSRRALEVQERWRTRALAKPPLPREQRKRLVEFYRDDVVETQSMIGRDLSGWLQ